MSIRTNIEKIKDRIGEAEKRAGREPHSVRLMAVSKLNPQASVLEAIGAGLFLFGENRVQEAGEKFPGVFAHNPAAELHLIGSLQRNKVKQILPLVSCVQSVDRAELLAEIEKQAAALNRTVQVLFEFHTGEESKSGFIDTDSLFRSIEGLQDMPHVRCAGLMTMAPFTPEVSLVRQSFRTLVSVQKECSARFSSLSFDVLSMGMSADYEIAIEEGSTLVRVGRAIFGETS